MALLKKRGFAAAVLAVVILIMTPVGGAISLNRASNRVEAQFYDGVGTAGAVNDYLTDISRASLGLVSVGANYEDLAGKTASLRNAREALLDAGSPSAAGMAYLDVLEAFGDLRSALISRELSEYDSDSVEEYTRLFDGAQGAINRSGYSEAVDDFMNDVYGRFPASIIASLFNVDPPENFV